MVPFKTTVRSDSSGNHFESFENPVENKFGGVCALSHSRVGSHIEKLLKMVEKSMVYCNYLEKEMSKCNK